MKLILVLVLSTLLLLNVSAQETVRLFGKVTDFNSIPIDSVSVLLKNDKFENLYKTMTDKDGNYSMAVPKGKYYCLYAIKSKDYLRTKLEYWAWNVPLYNDLNLNPQYERMEIYGVNAFEPQVGPFDTYIIYFRPMSLTNFLRFTNGRNIRELEQKAYKNHDTIDIAPNKISPDELLIKINEKDAKVLTVQKIIEYTRGGYMYSYLVQVLKPQELTATPEEFDKISIILHSAETNEIGKSEVFVKTRNY